MSVCHHPLSRIASKVRASNAAEASHRGRCGYPLLDRDLAAHAWPEGGPVAGRAVELAMVEGKLAPEGVFWGTGQSNASFWPSPPGN